MKNSKSSKTMKFNTAESLEDLDIAQELASYDEVLVVETREQMYWLNSDIDADFFIEVRDRDSLDKVKQLLNLTGSSAHIESYKEDFETFKHN